MILRFVILRVNRQPQSQDIQLAVDRRFRRDGDSQTADFIGCVAFGRQAEFAEKYLRKGTKIALTGRIQTGSYTNRDGQKVYTTDVVVEEQEFAESKSSKRLSMQQNYCIRQTAPVPKQCGKRWLYEYSGRN